MTQEHCHIRGERRQVREEEEAHAREKAVAAFIRRRGDMTIGEQAGLSEALDAYRAELTLQALRSMGVRGTL